MHRLPPVKDFGKLFVTLNSIVLNEKYIQYILFLWQYHDWESTPEFSTTWRKQWQTTCTYSRKNEIFICMFSPVLLVVRWGQLGINISIYSRKDSLYSPKINPGLGPTTQFRPNSHLILWIMLLWVLIGDMIAAGLMGVDSMDSNETFLLQTCYPNPHGPSRVQTLKGSEHQICLEHQICIYDWVQLKNDLKTHLVANPARD